jgi:oxygen-independent coproporphyrinogen-3 oxidase
MPLNVVNPQETSNRLDTCAAHNRTTTIYIHIPFCDQLCTFCGFNKFLSSEETKAAYVDALISEMRDWAKKPWTQSILVEAVYLGGGTPNSLTAHQLARILMELKLLFPISEVAQITCEGTPMNFTEDRIAELKSGGVNRVSTGIQTFNRSIREEHLHMRDGKDELLGYINRIAENFSSFNLDLIFNLPRQTDEIWADDLDTALRTPTTHITIYPLVLLEKTAFYSDFVKKGKYENPSQEREIKLFRKSVERFRETPFYAGQYTIRDWAKPGYACEYIKLNAESSHVLAFGAGAHGFVAGFTYRNESSPHKYIEHMGAGSSPMCGQTFCTEGQLFERFFVMGLRLTSFNLQKFSERFNKEIPEQFMEKLLVLEENNYIRIEKSAVTFTEEGHLWANNIRSYFESIKAPAVGYSNTLAAGKTGKDHYSEISRVKATDAEAS